MSPGEVYMNCQDCKTNEAHVHLTQIINNEKTTLNLCKDCAAARGFHSPLDNVPFPLAEILSGLAANVPAHVKAVTEEQLVCSNCGLDFEGFTRQGRFGCGSCYKAFRVRLEPIMRKIHGASLHRGNIPASQPIEDNNEHTISVKEENRLETELRKAIEIEDFERAAEIRDKLATIRCKVKIEL